MVKDELSDEEKVEPSSSRRKSGGASSEKMCILCQKGFVSVSSANRHLRTIHGVDTSSGNAGLIIDKPDEEDMPTLVAIPPLLTKEENTEKAEGRNGALKNCDLCQKSFSTGSTLNRHLRRVHGVDTTRTDSSLPPATLDFSALSSLILSALPQPLEITVDSSGEGIGLMGEVKEENGKEEDQDSLAIDDDIGLNNDNDGDAASETASRDYDECGEIRCNLCGKSFSQPSTLNRHLRGIHKLTTVRKEHPMKPTACPVCGEILRSQSLALRHRREEHGSTTKISRLGTQCPIKGCEWTGHTHRDLVSHAQSAHSSATAQYEWQRKSYETRDEFEEWLNGVRSQGVEWFSRSSKTTDGVKQEYRYCYLEIGGRGKKEKQRHHCTSYIKVLLHDDDSVSTEFCLDHLGHEGKNRRSRNGKEKEETDDEEMVEDQESLPEESIEQDDIAGPSRNSKNPDVSLICADTLLDADLSPSSSRARRCHNCGKEFSCGSTLYRHLREVHKEEHPKSDSQAIVTPCAVCGEIFPSGAQMRVHRSSAHPGSLGHRMNCPIETCTWNGSTHHDLIKHARASHSSAESHFKWQTRVFSCQDEFNEWLEELKRRGVHFYIRRSEKKRSLKVENRCCYFEENRARGVSSPSRQRNKFSRKSVGSCTCYLTLTIHEDGTIATGYCLDHLGHTVDLNARPFKQDGIKEEISYEDEDGDDEDEGEGIEDENDGVEEEPFLEEEDRNELFALSPESDNIPQEPITVHDLHRFQESLARISAGAARLQYSHEMDRLVAYLDNALHSTGIPAITNGNGEGTHKKRRQEESLLSNGKRVKREE